MSDDDDKLNPVVDFVAHHWWSFWAGIIAVEIVGAFLNGLTFLLVIVAITVWAFITKRSNIVHGKNLCLRCIKDVPTNPQEEVEKHLRPLKLVHFLDGKPLIILLLLPLWFGYTFVSTWIQISLGVPDVIQKALGPIVIFTPFLIMDRATSLHNRLQPWCPYCRGRGGGGDDVPEVVPDPDPSGAKTV